MKRKNHVLIQLSILIIFTMNAPQLHSVIKKKILKDGTIEYYSNVEGANSAYKKVIFKSPYIPLINKISKQEEVDPYIIKCIIKIESNFKADAVSVAGAMGLMQIMQVVARFYDIKDPLDPEENLKVGIKHFKSLLKYFKNDIPLSLAAYHAGIGRVKKKMKIPPIESTISYVKKIMYLYNGKKMGGIGKKVKSLYKRIKKDGTIVISDR